VKEYCQSCDVCQRVGNPSRRDEIPLNPQVMLQAFEKWAIDFVGPINPQERRSGERYIITVTRVFDKVGRSNTSYRLHCRDCCEVFLRM
jgi:hypothetical protein